MSESATVREALLRELAVRSVFWRGERVLRAVDEALERSDNFRGGRSGNTERHAPREAHRAIGTVIAPAFASFSLHALERARERGLRRMFFLAREGETFMRMYRRLARVRSVDEPPATYLAVNRRSLYLASMESFDAEGLARLWAQYPAQTVGTLLRNLSLPEAPFVPLAMEAGFEGVESAIGDPAHDDRFARFAADARVREAFLARRDEARRSLVRYLRQRGYFGEGTVGIVDVGWTGSMQTSLALATRHEPDRPALDGMYLALTYRPGSDPPGSQRCGYLCDTRSGDWMQECILRCNSVFEMLATAPHGSAAGFREDSSGRVRPIVRSGVDEADLLRGPFRRARAGVWAWFEVFVREPGARAVTAAELRPAVLDRMRRFVLYPTRAEALAFLDYAHEENFGVYGSSRFAFQGSAWRALCEWPWWHGPRRLAGLLRTQRWAEGALKRSGVPMANFALDLLDTRYHTRA
ncbi:MAG: hypothetical protein KIS87_00865 [Phycisphaeraceae bacterium]|nr:hypothetical protein [Phycisphaeraceae bacterium]